MIIEALSMSTSTLEALSCISDRPVEALLLGRGGENDEPVAEPRVDRPRLAGTLLKGG